MSEMTLTSLLWLVLDVVVNENNPFGIVAKAFEENGTDENDSDGGAVGGDRDHPDARRKDDVVVVVEPVANGLPTSEFIIVPTNECVCFCEYLRATECASSAPER